VKYNYSTHSTYYAPYKALIKLCNKIVFSLMVLVPIFARHYKIVCGIVGDASGRVGNEKQGGLPAKLGHLSSCV
jgi:hypothetical protein